MGNTATTFTGKCKFFDATKGWGFITPDDGSKELFVHYSEIKKDGFRALEDGERVRYEVATVPKGLKAIRVTPI